MFYQRHSQTFFFFYTGKSFVVKNATSTSRVGAQIWSVQNCGIFYPPLLLLLQCNVNIEKKTNISLYYYENILGLEELLKSSWEHIKNSWPIIPKFPKHKYEVLLLRKKYVIFF